jgi:hypothetical protein
MDQLTSTKSKRKFVVRHIIAFDSSQIGTGAKNLTRDGLLDCSPQKIHLKSKNTKF